MDSPRKPLTIAPFTAAVLALVPAVALARCGLFPTFDNPADAGTDARDVPRDMQMDRPEPMDVVDVETPDTMIPDAADVMMTADGGFRMCAMPPSAGPFAPEIFARRTDNARDLAFDGRGRFATASRLAVTVDPMGMEMPLGMTDVFAVGVRYLPNGDLVVTSSMVGGEQSVRTISPTGTVRTLAMGFMFPSGLAVDGNGAIYFTDTRDNAVRRIGPGEMTSTVVTTEIATPTGLALTPDFRRLYVGSPSQGRVYYLDLAPNGMVIGTPRVHVEGTFSANGLAFDACGYLYVSDRDRGRILQVPPSGGRSEVIVDRPMGIDGVAFSPWGLAFGQGPGFEPRALYVVNAANGSIYRVNVGIEGARVVTPGM